MPWRIYDFLLVINSYLLAENGAPLPIFPLELHGEVKRQETRVMGLLCGKVA